MTVRRDKPPIEHPDGEDIAPRRLRESEDRFRALVEAIGQLVWTTPPDGLVVDIPQWRVYTGQSLKRVRGWGWLDAIHPDDRETVRQAWTHALATRSRYEVEYRLRRYDGVYRYFLVRAAPVLGPDGEIREWVGVHTDITERRTLEEALQRTAREAEVRAAELEATFDAMADGVIFYDAVGRMLRINHWARVILTLYTDTSDYLMPLHERNLTLLDTHGLPLAKEEWPIARVLRGETLSAADAVDVLVRGFNGQEILLSLTGAPVRTADGTIAGGILGMRDVTRHRRAGERARAALDALLAMAETLVVGSEVPLAQAPVSGMANPVAQRLAVLTQQVVGCQRLSISAIEPESERMRPIAVVGLSPEQEAAWWETEGRGGPLRELVQPDLLTRLEAGELVVIDVREPPYDELPNPYGMTVIVTAPMRVGDRLVGLLALDYAGADHIYSEDELAVIGAVATLGALGIERERLLREREESRANELVLRETTRRFDEFLSIASHELRTPLTSIRANAQLAARRLDALDQAVHDGKALDHESSRLGAVRTLLERAERQTGLLNRLVDDLLDVSRIQADKLEFRFEPTELRSVVREAVQEQRMAWLERPIELDMPAAPVPVVADADRIGQVVTNFLTNALKYSEEDRPVAVRVESDGATARVSVQDAGPGLPPEEQERVWERFHRAPGVHVLAGSGVGLGLGLHISKTIVERHGGRVGVESTPGSGSTFWFELPAQEA